MPRPTGPLPTVSPSPTASPRGEKRRRALSLITSFAIHLVIALLFVWAGWLEARQHRHQMGSQELDVDLVAPRLAPPVEHWGRSEAHAGRARTERTRPSDGRKRGQEDWSRPRPQRAPQRSQTHRTRREERRSQPEERDDRSQRDPTRPPREQREQLAHRQQQQQPPTLDPEQAEASGVLAAAQPMHLALAEQPELADIPLPEGPSPVALLDAVKREGQRRKQQHQQAVAHSRQRAASAEAHLAHSERTVHCSAGTFQTSAVGLGGRDARGDREAVGGRTPLYGLKFYLSGRRVKTSHVVRPPELIDMPRVGCKVTSLSITPATVRMLVETSGKVGHLYLKRSSGSRTFDRCALRHAGKMRFHPGTDVAGAPLNVWINLRVEPGVLTAGL